ncbi:hypothetical protein EVG20_g10727 [Dentipellis fragilis]|uniref:Uncharacterized protein n=1 Tax=Dentipellis fragilis TaxID=205917 RepID=A0A4Y9XQK9_9AGAM|nr:hypothetical protein EVG20_g10727 [Dentipellis fragilis]
MLPRSPDATSLAPSRHRARSACTQADAPPTHQHMRMREGADDNIGMEMARDEGIGLKTPGASLLQHAQRVAARSIADPASLHPQCHVITTSVVLPPSRTSVHHLAWAPHTRSCSRAFMHVMLASPSMPTSCRRACRSHRGPAHSLRRRTGGMRTPVLPSWHPCPTLTASVASASVHALPPMPSSGLHPCPPAVPPALHPCCPLCTSTARSAPIPSALSLVPFTLSPHSPHCLHAIRTVSAPSVRPRSPRCACVVCAAFAPSTLSGTLSAAPAPSALCSRHPHRVRAIRAICTASLPSALQPLLPVHFSPACCFLPALSFSYIHTVSHDSHALMNTADPPVDKKNVTFIAKIFLAVEMQKAASKRIALDAKVSLSTDEPWDTVKAQLLAKVAATLAPDILDFGDYHVLVSIARVLLKPGTSLENEDNYDFFLKMVCKVKGIEVTTNLVIEEKAKNVVGADKENEGTAPGTKKANQKGQKDPVILPANVKRGENIMALKDREHLPLNQDRLNAWALAMLKGDAVATIERPPRHKLFDIGNIGLTSPVLAHCMEAQQGKGASAAPVFNFSIGNEVLGLFCLNQDLSTNCTATAPNLDVSDSLIPLSRVLGADMSLADFCIAFDLSDAILEKFTKNSYRAACALHYVKVNELKEMGFLLGEIAMLRDAVDSWSIVPDSTIN